MLCSEHSSICKNLTHQIFQTCQYCHFKSSRTTMHPAFHAWLIAAGCWRIQHWVEPNSKQLRKTICCQRLSGWSSEKSSWNQMDKHSLPRTLLKQLFLNKCGLWKMQMMTAVHAKSFEKCELFIIKIFHWNQHEANDDPDFFKTSHVWRSLSQMQKCKSEKCMKAFSAAFTVAEGERLTKIVGGTDSGFVCLVSGNMINVFGLEVTRPCQREHNWCAGCLNGGKNSFMAECFHHHLKNDPCMTCWSHCVQALSAMFIVLWCHTQSHLFSGVPLKQTVVKKSKNESHGFIGHWPWWSCKCQQHWFEGWSGCLNGKNRCQWRLWGFQPVCWSGCEGTDQVWWRHDYKDKQESFECEACIQSEKQPKMQMCQWCLLGQGACVKVPERCVKWGCWRHQGEGRGKLVPCPGMTLFCSQKPNDVTTTLIVSWIHQPIVFDLRIALDRVTLYKRPPDICTQKHSSPLTPQDSVLTAEVCVLEAGGKASQQVCTVAHRAEDNWTKTKLHLVHTAGLLRHQCWNLLNR